MQHDLERWGSPTMINNRFVALAAVSARGGTSQQLRRARRRLRRSRAERDGAGHVLRGRRIRIRRHLVDVLEPGDDDHEAGLEQRIPCLLHRPESTIHPAPGTSPFLAFPPARATSSGPATSARKRSCRRATRYQLSDNVWIGLSTSAPFGLVTKPEPVWSGQIYARTSKVFSLNLNPIVGVKLTDWLSIAAGPAPVFRRQAPVGLVLLATAPTTTLEGDDVGVGATAGALLTLPTNTQIGVGFRSAIRHELWGEIESQSPRREVPIEAKLTLPETVTVGLTQSFTPYFRVHAGFEWTNWSRLSSPVVGTIPVLAATASR